LTRHFAKLSISPESSDGFASVGTILPKEEATLLPGGFFASRIQLLGDWGAIIPDAEDDEKNLLRSLKTPTLPPMHRSVRRAT
jgi:hypothetical protein